MVDLSTVGSMSDISDDSAGPEFMIKLFDHLDIQFIVFRG